jgi:hypothetical protein
MTVKPASEMDDATFRKHLEIRHPKLHDKLRRLSERPKADRIATLAGARNLHRTEHRIAPERIDEPHEHRAE